MNKILNITLLSIIFIGCFFVVASIMAVSAFHQSFIFEFLYFPTKVIFYLSLLIIGLLGIGDEISGVVFADIFGGVILFLILFFLLNQFDKKTRKHPRYGFYLKLFIIAILFLPYTYIFLPKTMTKIYSEPIINSCLNLTDPEKMRLCTNNAMYQFDESYRKKYDSDLMYLLINKRKSISEAVSDIVNYCKEVDSDKYNGLGADLLLDVSNDFSNFDYCITIMTSEAFVHVISDFELSESLCKSLDSVDKIDACFFYQNIYSSSRFMPKERLLKNCDNIIHEELHNTCNVLVESFDN